MTFERFPVVQLERGHLKEHPEEPLKEALTRLSKAHDQVYLVDLEGLRANKSDLELLAEATRNANLWVDAGSRYATDVMDLFIAGAERVTVRWNTVHDFEELAEAVAFSEEVFLGVEFREAFIDNPRDPARTPDLLFQRAEALGIGLVIIDLLAGTAQVRPSLASTGARFRGEKWYAGGQGAAYDRETLENLAYSGTLVPAAALARERSP